MCTAAAYKTRDFYFGRTLDYEFSYGDEVIVTPRRFPFSMRSGRQLTEHYALIGAGCVLDGYPLYYDAVNEKGLAMAGLNFVGNAVYGDEKPGMDNLAQFEFIPWILGQCASVAQARELLHRVQLTREPFRPDLPVSDLHWILADRREAITVEAVKEGLMVYENPLGVLTNNPPFPQQMFNLNQYMHLSPRTPENHFSSRVSLTAYSRGMGALGLPGDLSSQSRFVRVAFTAANSRSGDSEEESVSQLFHILGSVDQTRGCCDVGDGKYEITLYTGCCNADKGIYYYRTYDGTRITGVDMHREKLDGAGLICYPMLTGQPIEIQNAQREEKER